MPEVPLQPDGCTPLVARETQFMGPAEGPAVDLVHAVFRATLSAQPQVERAYLCEVRHDGEEDNHMALCLVSSTGEDMGVVTAVSAVMRDCFSQKAHIDLCFLSPDMEQRLEAVCCPFYSRVENLLVPATENGLFRCPIKVRPGPGCEKPANWVGAYVECFVGAVDHLSALRLAVERLADRGWLYEEVVGGKVDQLNPARWDDYMAIAPKEWAEHLPPKALVVGLVQAGEMFFGPFGGWESGGGLDAAPDQPHD
jgi:hypothetical protein